jgi:hypothetical protein
MPGSRPRKSRNWIESFVSSSNHSNSPAIYRKWTAIATLGAALQRRCYLLIQGEPLFCNFYIVLVGPPGVGKTRALRIGSQLLSQLKDFRMSPNSLTRQKLVDNLAQCIKITPDKDGVLHSQTAYTCFLDELSTFIQPKDYELMTFLTDFFDCPKVWRYETISRGEQTIENLFLTIAGGITPKSIQANWGEAAIGMGFTARLNFVFSEDAKPIDLFGLTDEPDYRGLLADLQTIYGLAGRFRVTPGAGKMLQSWVSSGMPPIPADTRFAEYTPRRSIHWLKLCMVYSIAESNDLIITESHAEQAKATLLEAEGLLPFVFEHIGQNPLLAALNNIHRWMKIEFMATREPLLEARIRRRLMIDIPPQYVDAALNELVGSGLCKVAITGKGKVYTPELTRTGVDDV